MAPKGTERSGRSFRKSGGPRDRGGGRRCGVRSSWHSQNRPPLQTEATATQHSCTGIQRPAHMGSHRPVTFQSTRAALDIQMEQPHYCTHACTYKHQEPSLPPPACHGSLSLPLSLPLLSLSLFAAIDLATHSSSPGNQFRPVLGLQRQTIPAYAPSLPCSSRQPPPHQPAAEEEKEEGGAVGEKNKGKQGRENTGRTA